MSFIDRDNSTFTTNSSGEATITTKALTGLLHSITYIPDASSALSTAAIVTVAAAGLGVNVLTVNPFNSTVGIVYQPRTSIHSTAGSTVAGFAQFPLSNERLTFTITGGGATKLGTFRTDVS